MERRIKRQQGDQNSILRKVKFVPFFVSCFFFVVLLLVRVTPDGKIGKPFLSLFDSPFILALLTTDSWWILCQGTTCSSAVWRCWCL